MTTLFFSFASPFEVAVKRLSVSSKRGDSQKEADTKERLKQSLQELNTLAMFRSNWLTLSFQIYDLALNKTRIE